MVLRGEAVHDHVKAFVPPFDEFEVLAIDVPSGSTIDLPLNPGPMLLMVQRGNGSADASSSLQDGALVNKMEVARGSILFVPAGTRLTLSAGSDHNLFVWGAACNSRVFKRKGSNAEDSRHVGKVAAA